MRFFIDMAAIAALLIAASCIEARADNCAWAVLTVGSKHIGAEPGSNYNERNWGPGAEHCIGRLFGVEVRGAAGFFRNSNRVDSFYFGGSATVFEVGPVKAGVALLQVGGYEVDAITALLPVVAIEGKQLGANLSYVPPHGKNVGAVGLQLKVRWR